MQKKRATGFEDDGGYMKSKIMKLRNQQNYGRVEVNSKSNIFEGVSICVNGYTEPNSTELKKIISENGGIFNHYPNGTVTHTIASNLAQGKIAKLTSKDKVMKPSWIVDSVNQGHLLEEKDYRLFHNEVKVNVLSFKNSSNHPKAGDENFMDEFFGHSRLHQIATWGMEFKQLVLDLRSDSNFKMINVKDIADEDSSRYFDKITHKCNSNCAYSSKKVFIHFDMDCFFVSVGLKNRTDLYGSPVAVSHFTNNTSSNDEKFSFSEIASCNYEARAFGIKNGMLAGRAKQLCPKLSFLPYDFNAYKETATVMYRTIAGFTRDISALSCDECVIDATNLCKSINKSPCHLAGCISSNVYNSTGCKLSAGIGENLLLAKLAVKKAKPGGVYRLDINNVIKLLASYPVTVLPGVGRSLSNQFDALGVKTCADLQRLGISNLRSEFGGKMGENLYNLCRGRDSRELSWQFERKSVSTEVNYAIRFTKSEELNLFVKELATETHKRLVQAKMRGSVISLKVKIRSPSAPVEPLKFMGHGQCDNSTRSTTLLSPTDNLQVIQRESLSLALQFVSQVKDIRGLGVQISKLSPLCIKGGVQSMKKFLQPEAKKNPKTSEVKKQAQVKPIIIDMLFSDDEVDVLSDTCQEIIEDLDTESSIQKKAIEVISLSASDESQKHASSEPTIDLDLDPIAYRKIFQEWVKSSPFPIDEDIACVRKFFILFISKHRDYCTVTELLHCLQITILQRNSQEWSEAYNSIYKEVLDWTECHLNHRIII